VPWFDENGYPEKGDGRQGELERLVADWLTARGHEAGETTVRTHVNEWIEDYRRSVGV
jgi:hypothetical protein